MSQQHLTTSTVETVALKHSAMNALDLPAEKILAITVANFPALGKLAAMRFLEWTQDRPGGVIALPTGKTPEHFVKWVTQLLTTWDEAQTQQRLEQDVEDRNRQIADLEDEIRELDQKLGGVSEERVLLVQRLEAQAHLREQLRQVERMFSRTEAQVFRESEAVIVRMVGLNFASGQASVRGNEALLLKVQNAVQIFPRSTLIIEGHTDSYGSDATNQALSEKRASAVRQYLISAMRMSPRSISSIGYGETQPVANNETPEGRAKNRRIDIRITPSS